MGVYRCFECNGARLLIWKITESEDELRSMLPIVEPFAEYKSVSRRIECLAVHVCLQYLYGSFVRVQHEESGKPFLPDCSQYLSISHTKGYVVVALSNSAIGVDVEQLSTRALKIESRFANKEEVPIHSDFGIRTAEIAAVLVWSAKESLFKIMDEVAVDFKKHLHLTPFSLHTEGRVMAHETKTSHQLCYEVFYQIFDQFVLTFCFKR